MSRQSVVPSSQEGVQRSGGAPVWGQLLSPPCGSSLSSSHLCSSPAFRPPPHLLSFGVCPGPGGHRELFREFPSSFRMSPEPSASHLSKESLRASSPRGSDRWLPVCGKPRSAGAAGSSCSSLSFPSVNGCSPVSSPSSQYISSPELPRASYPSDLPVGSSRMAECALSPSCLSRSSLSLFSSCPLPCPGCPRASSSASTSHYRGHCCCCHVGAASVCSPRCFLCRKSVVASFSSCHSNACHSLHIASCTSSLPSVDISKQAPAAVNGKADDASRAKKARMDSGLAGALSGIACATILQPLDVIKTQQQQQLAPGTRHSPPSVGQICKRIYTMWGWRGFWRGLWPCLLRVGPGVGIYFYSLDFLTDSWKFIAAAAKKANAVAQLEDASLAPSGRLNGSAQGADTEAGSRPLSNALQKAEERKAPPWYNAAVSAIARGVAVLVFNPISVIKTRVESSWSSSASPPPIHSVVVSMWRQEGPLSIFRGAWPTILRDVPFSGIFLGLYTWSRTRAGLDKPRDQVEYFPVKNFACGASAAAVASVVTHPFDVIRTRIQLYGMLQQQHEEALRSSRSVESKSGLSARVSANGKGRPCEPMSAFEAAGKRPHAYVTCKQGNLGQPKTSFPAVGRVERPAGQVRMFFSSGAAPFSRCQAKTNVTVRLWGDLPFAAASEHGKRVAGRCGEVMQIYSQQCRAAAGVSLDTLKKLSGVRRQVRRPALSIVSNNCLHPACSAPGAPASAPSFLQVSLSRRSFCIFSRFFDARAPFSSQQSSTARTQTCFFSLLSPNRGDAVLSSQRVLGSSVGGGASSGLTQRAVSDSGPKSRQCVTMTRMMIETVREEGLMVLWRGLGARLAKRSLMSAMTWTSFEELRVFFGGLRA